MKKILLITLLVFVGICSFGRHLKGGYFTYQYLGPGSGTNLRYKITLTVYMDCSATGNQIDDPISFTFFDGSSNQFLQNQSAPKVSEYFLSKNADEPCITGDQTGCYYKIVVYELASVELPANSGGYSISYQRCCRIENIVNLNNSGQIGNTYSIKIPGTSGGTGFEKNNSAVFPVNDTAVICAGSYFTYPIAASDPDNDSLVYTFCNAWPGGSASQPAPATATSPPYSSVSYSSSFSGSQPMGSGVTINRTTGLISGVAPNRPGEYVITVCVSEYRNGVLVAVNRKELHIRAGDCIPIKAQLPISTTTCDGLTQTFQNSAPSTLINSWYWDFGVASQNSDTSNLEKPTFTFPDTGIYVVKLVVNRGELCSDSATMKLGVYPGFFPAFSAAGICVNKPTQFTDMTSTAYGFVDSWSWDFGEAGKTTDISNNQNPAYTYPLNNTYNVRFIVTNSKGCVDTLFQDVSIIDKPPIGLPFKDTLICSIDSLQISAAGNGIFAWTPGYNIINANTSSPIVYPKTTTWYKVNLDDNGCLNNDSVRVRVVDFVSLSVRGDSTICESDPVQLFANTDGLQFLWTQNPALPANLDNPTLKNPIATPAVTTNYQLTATIGKCNASSNLTVTTVPYPLAIAGLDTNICYGTSAQLNGHVNPGATFNWSPSSSLSNAQILNPVATPPLTGINNYILTSFETNGCPKPGRDTVSVIVLPKVNAFAGNDTSIVVGQPLQLLATGGITYLWVPPLGLNNINIPDPVAILDGNPDSIRYKVYVQDLAGCLDSASLLVKIFKVVPQIFVPTAFTPNNDGLNDKLAPIAVGIKRIEYFRIYNRWGQLVFSTSINGKGWDGKIGGKEQSSNTYVWLVKAIDYLDRPIFQKGTVALIK